jgi:ADP-ribose pyrophosphatase YjhB (NUDIX family)
MPATPAERRIVADVAYPVHSAHKKGMAISPYLRRLREALGHELVLVPSVTGVIFDERARMLLVEDAETGVWVAPGGVVEPGERPAEAVVRELHEELGVTVEPVAILGVFGGDGFVVEYANGDRTAYVMTVFECRVVDGIPEADGQEVCALRWVDEHELGRLRLAGWAARVLPLVRDGRRRACFEAGRP